MEQIKIGKKLTLGDMGFDSDTLAAIVEDSPGETPILNVMALVSGVKVETNRIDPTKTSNRFLGQFEGVNLLTGQTGIFAEAFFPGVVDSYVSGIKGSVEGAATLAFTVTVMKDEAKNSAQGYKFGMLALVNKTAEADPFQAFRAHLPAPAASQKAIVAPSKGNKKK